MDKLEMSKCYKRCYFCRRKINKDVGPIGIIEHPVPGEERYLCCAEGLCAHLARQGLSCNLCMDKELIEKNMF
mgnify:CR=1 FL=1